MCLVLVLCSNFVLSSFVIIPLPKRGLVAYCFIVFLVLCFCNCSLSFPHRALCWFLVWLIVAYPDHTHLLFEDGVMFSMNYTECNKKYCLESFFNDGVDTKVYNYVIISRLKSEPLGKQINRVT